MKTLVSAAVIFAFSSVFGRGNSVSEIDFPKLDVPTSFLTPRVQDSAILPYGSIPLGPLPCEVSATISIGGEKQIISRMPIMRPPVDVDRNMPVKRPDPNIAYTLVVKKPAIETEK